MLRAFMLFGMSIGLLALIVAVATSGVVRQASACSGGTDLQFAAQRARLIVIGDAVEVGDEINRASTVTATPLRTATPVSPPLEGQPTYPPYATPVGFTLVGYGVTLRVLRAYASDPQVAATAQPVVEVDHETRRNIERALRELEAGRGVSSCAPDAFAFRFEQGARYLVFAGDDQREFGLWVIWRVRVEGADVLLSDPLHPSVDDTSLSMTAEQYHRFFEGVTADVREGFAVITTGRVPLASVLRLVAAIRGDPSIAPPDTGSAGLASGR